MNKFDQLDRPFRTDHDYPGSGQDEGILHLYDRHFENGLLIMGTATLINSLSHNHRGQLTRLNRPGDVLDTLYFYYGAAASHPATGFVDGNYRLQNVRTPGPTPPSPSRSDGPTRQAVLTAPLATRPSSMIESQKHFSTIAKL
jgi:hypothetical protein